MPFRLLSHAPVETIRNDMSVSPITTAAYTTLVAATGKACSSMEIYNPSGSTIKLALGAAGFEVDIPYTVIPGGSFILMPLEIARGKRISAKAVDQNAVTNIFVLNLLG